VAALLADAAPAEHDDAVGDAHRGEAVGDQQRDRPAAGPGAGGGDALEEGVLGGAARAAVGSSSTVSRGARRIRAPGVGPLPGLARPLRLPLGLARLPVVESGGRGGRRGVGARARRRP
jgi:hypothetical protein